MPVSYISVVQDMQNCFLKSLIKEKVCHYLPGNMGGRGIMKKVTKIDIGDRGV